VTTKEQMMAEFDQLVTDRRLTRRLAEQTLADSAHEPRLLFDQYVCLASGGSSGLRGLFVQTLDEYAAFIASVLRRVMATAIPPTAAPPGRPVAALIAAGAVHASGLLGALPTGYPFRLVSVPATVPLKEAVGRLNDAHPAIVLGHTSKLALLAREQQAGRLQITPRSVTAMGEPVTDEDRALIATAFGVLPSPSSTPPKAWSAQASPAAPCRALPPTCASPSRSTQRTVPCP
jgi:phenylacetate-CoA ligase